MNDNATVKIGSLVRVQDCDGEEEFTIAGREEADAMLMRISMESPLGIALLGRTAGEQVKVRTPDGLRAVTILGIG